MRFSRFRWLLPVFVLLLPASVNAQSTPTSTVSQLVISQGPVTIGHFNPGDRLRITVQLQTSDLTSPESSEGEGCLHLSFVSTLPSTRGVNIPCDVNLNFSAIFVVPTDSLTGYSAIAEFSTFDGDESAVVTIVTNPVEVLTSTPDEVDHFERMAIAFDNGALAARFAEKACVRLRTPAAVELCAALEQTLEALDEVGARYYENLAAQDPPDSNFTRLAQLQRRATSQDGRSAVAGAAMRLVGNEQQQIDLMRAVTTTINRASSAANAGDSSSKRRQLEYAAYLLRLLSENVERQGPLQADLARTWLQAGYPNLTPTAADIHNVQLALNAMGFSPQEVQVLVRNGLTLQDIGQLKTELVSFNFNEVAASGGFPASLTSQSSLSALHDAARSFADLAAAAEKKSRSHDRD